MVVGQRMGKHTGLVCILLAPVCVPHAPVCVPLDPVCTLLAPERVPLIIWDLRGTRKRKKYKVSRIYKNDSYHSGEALSVYNSRFY